MGRDLPAQIAPNEKLLLEAVRKFEPKAKELGRVQRLTGGASQETWRIEIQTGRADQEIILRRIPETIAVSDHQIGPEAEAELISRARNAGVPVPRVRLVLTPDDGLGRGFFSDFVQGETLARRIQRDAAFDGIRDRLAYEWGLILARIHNMDVVDVGLPVRPAKEQLFQLQSQYERFQRPSAVIELAFKWLTDRLPIREKSGLVHADFRIGNIMVCPSGVSAVLDWEMSYIGDPVADLGWLTANSWRFGNIDRPVGGIGNVADLLDGYRDAGGAAIEPVELRFWQAFASLKWAIMCMEMSQLDASGEVSPERAMVGRRVSECEIDLLDIIEDGL